MWLHTISFVGIYLLLASNPLRAAGEISEQQAIEIANKAIVKYHVQPKQWTIQAYKDPHDWQLTRESWEKWVATIARGMAPETNARIAQIEAAIKGKDVWFVTYLRIVPPGIEPLHPHALVFVDAQTGQVLELIHPEE